VGRAFLSVVDVSKCPMLSVTVLHLFVPRACL
jgi:hypothetical protein